MLNEMKALKEAMETLTLWDWLSATFKIWFCVTVSLVVLGLFITANERSRVETNETIESINLNKGPRLVLTIGEAFLDVLQEHAKVQPNLTEVEISAAFAFAIGRVAYISPDPSRFKRTTAMLISPSCGGLGI